MRHNRARRTKPALLSLFPISTERGSHMPKDERNEVQPPKDSTAPSTSGHDTGSHPRTEAYAGMDSLSKNKGEESQDITAMLGGFPAGDLLDPTTQARALQNLDESL